MFESVVAQRLAERGFQQKKIEQGVEDLLDVLEIRFGSSTVATLKPSIETITQRHSLK